MESLAEKGLAISRMMPTSRRPSGATTSQRFTFLFAAAFPTRRGSEGVARRARGKRTILHFFQTENVRIPIQRLVVIGDHDCDISHADNPEVFALRLRQRDYGQECHAQEQNPNSETLLACSHFFLAFQSTLTA